MRACSKSERTEEGMRSRPRFSAASFTIMNIRLYVLCCLLGSRAYTIGKVWPYLMMWMKRSDKIDVDMFQKFHPHTSIQLLLGDEGWIGHPGG